MNVQTKARGAGARVAISPPVERDWDYLVQSDRIHQSLYTDPSLFPDEMTKLFGGVWTDDLEMFERCWEGMQAAEAEWVLCSRGAQRPDGETLDPVTGVRTVPPTDEAPMRNFYRQYAYALSKETKLAVA
jgi:hypothetical protein